MNPDFRKVALIAAGLGLIVSLFVALRSDDDDGGAATTATATAPATTAPTTTEAPPATTEAPPATTTAPATTETGPVELRYAVVGGRPEGGIARDTVELGRAVVITVTADVTDEIHLHGYDLSADVAPGSPATIRFTADAPGRFEIELENTGVQIAELEVRP